MIDRRFVLGAGLAATLPAGVAAANGAGEAAMPLWPGRPPGSPERLPVLKPDNRGTELWLTGIGRPTIQAYRPARSSGIGVLVIPGGGYEFLAISNEGSDVAARLASLGFTAFVLTYRLPAEGWRAQADVPLQDAQRAMRLIRADATRYGIDPERLGIIGHSAGGHLAASLATGFDERVYAPVDARDTLSAKPAFAGLMYAVTTLELPDTHVGSRERLLGKQPTAAEVARRSPLLHLGAGMPPCFLLHAFDDTVVPVSCSTRWMAAAQAKRLPIEAHFIARGGHGFGVRLPDGTPGSLWPQLFVWWVAETLA